MTTTTGAPIAPPLPRPRRPPPLRVFARASGTPYFWIIAAMLVVAGVLHYFGPIVIRISPGIPWGLDEYSMDRAIFLLPITYAGFVFGSAGGMTVLTLAAAIMLPSCFFSDHPREALTESGAVLLVGALVTSWFQAQAAERERRRRTLAQLVRTQQELHDHVEALRSEEQIRAALNEVYSLCSESLELGATLRASLDKIMEVTGTEGALVWLRDEETGDLELAAHQGIPLPVAAELARVPAGQGLNGWVVRTEEALAVPDLASDPRLCKPAVVSLGIHSAMFAPVRTGGRVFGTICAGTRARRDFRPEDLDLLTSCGSALGVALENTRLYDQARTSERRYRDLFEHANDAIFVHDMTGRIRTANEACTRLTGYTQAELLGMDTGRLFGPADVEKARALERLLEAGDASAQDQRLELTLQRKDGRAVTVDLASTMLRGPDGAPGIQHIARDVTVERRAQERLRSFVRQIARAQEDERLRISRDLHDETAQSLLLVSQRLDALAANERFGLGEEARKSVEDVRGLALQTLADLRRLSEALRPRILDDLGLVPAVGWIADQLGDDGIKVHVDIRGEERTLPRDREVLLFRIAQEALSNVRRHSQATNVEVLIEFREREVILTVSDDGIGFPVTTSPDELAATGKLGILGMMERANLLGGHLIVASEPGAGTSVTAVVEDQA